MLQLEINIGSYFLFIFYLFYCCCFSCWHVNAFYCFCLHYIVLTKFGENVNKQYTLYMDLDQGRIQGEPVASQQEGASNQFAAGALFNLSNCLITDPSAISREMTVWYVWCCDS